MKKYKTYFMSSVEKSKIGENSIIGDFTRIRHSHLGEYVKIDRNCLIQNCYIGDYSYSGPFSMIFNAIIGKFTSISYGVTIGPPEHNYHRLSMHPFVYNKECEIFDESQLLRNDKFDMPCSIGNDVWIGCNSTILRGVEIPNGVVIGANTIVIKSPEPYSIVVGCPGTEKKKRFSKEIIDRLQQIQWWNWSLDKIRDNRHIFFSKQLTMEMLDTIV